MILFEQPNIILSPYIEGYLIFDMPDLTSLGQRTFLAMADPLNIMILNFGPPFTAVVHKNKKEYGTYEKSVFTGIFTCPSEVFSSNQYQFVAVIFKASGLKHFIKSNPDEFTNVIENVESIFGAEINEIEERLYHSVTTAQKIAIVEEFLYNKLQNHKPDYQISEMLYIIYGSNGTIPIHELARKYKFHQKYLTRKFKAAIGISPKLFSRIIRFRTVINHLSVGDINWVHRAFDNGYYDQSHLIKDFKEFSGLTPQDYLSRLPYMKNEKLLNEVLFKKLEFLTKEMFNVQTN